jgi:hypothetical protein
MDCPPEIAGTVSGQGLKEWLAWSLIVSHRLTQELSGESLVFGALPGTLDI